MKPYRAVAIRRRPTDQQDSAQDSEVASAFEALFEAWNTREMMSFAPRSVIASGQATDAQEAARADIAWKRQASEFRSLWHRWERAQRYAADACFTLLEGNYRLDWTDVNRRGRCLLETIGIHFLNEVLDAVAAMADECAVSWFSWLIGSNTGALSELHDQWVAEGCPPDWQGIGMYRLLNKLGEEAVKREEGGLLQ